MVNLSSAPYWEILLQPLNFSLEISDDGVLGFEVSIIFSNDGVFESERSFLVSNARILFCYLLSLFLDIMLDRMLSAIVIFAGFALKTDRPGDSLNEAGECLFILSPVRKWYIG